MRRNIILRQVPLFLIFTLVTCLARGFAQDKVAAIVNNDVITQKDLNDFLNFMRVQLSAEYKGEKLEAKIQSMKLDLLGRLIEDRLILQEAKNLKIIIDEARIKDRIEDMKNKIGSDTEFQNSLKLQGLVQADIEAKIRDQLLMYSVIEYKIKSKIVVDPSEITDFFGLHKDEFKSPEQREIQSVAVEDEALASQIANLITNGTPLEEIPAKFNASVNKFNVSKGEELKKEIETAIFNLNINEVSKPVKIENKFYIFRITKIIPASQESLDQARDTIQSYLFEKEMQEELGIWVDELKKRSYIKIL